MKLKRSTLGRRFLKLFFRIAVIWFALAALYVVLPSVSPSAGYLTDILNDGKPITRVFRSNAFFTHYSDHNPPASVPQSLYLWIQNFVVEFQVFESIGYNSIPVGFSTPSGSRIVTLSIGGGKDPLAKLPFGPILPELREYRISLNSLDEEEDSISEPFEVSVADASSSRSWHTLSRFSDADSTLLNWWLTPRSSIRLPLRVRRLARENLVEVWPEHSWWNTYPDKHTTPNHIDPLISIHFPSLNFNTAGGNRPHNFTFNFPSMISTSPTPHTYQARLLLLPFLLPVGIFGFGLLYILAWPLFNGIFLASIILSLVLNILAFFICVGLVYFVIWWWRNGRPSWSEVGARSRQWSGTSFGVGGGTATV